MAKSRFSKLIAKAHAKQQKTVSLGTSLKKSKLVRALTKKGPRLGTAIKRSIKKLQRARKDSKASRLHKAKKGHSWVFAKKVVIPARQMVPEGRWPKSWAKAFDEAADSVVKKIMWSSVDRK